MNHRTENETTRYRHKVVSLDLRAVDCSAGTWLTKDHDEIVCVWVLKRVTTLIRHPISGWTAKRSTNEPKRHVFQHSAKMAKFDKYGSPFRITPVYQTLTHNEPLSNSDLAKRVRLGFNLSFFAFGGAGYTYIFGFDWNAVPAIFAESPCEGCKTLDDYYNRDEKCFACRVYSKNKKDKSNRTN